MDLTGRHLYLRKSLDAPEVVACGPGTATVFTRPAPHRSGPDGNEDGALVLDLGRSRALLAVADGVGGGPAGAEATAAALTMLARHVVATVDSKPSFRAVIVDGIERAQEAVRDVGGGSATTLVVAGIEGDSLQPFHVGDSELLLVGQRGRVKHRTLAHSPVAYAQESGYLEEHEALNHVERHIISNALGLPTVRIEVGPRLRVAPRDTVVLATDGLLDNLFQDEIVSGIRTGPAAERSAKLASLVAGRMRREGGGKPGKPDDLTFILWRAGAGDGRASV